MNAGGYLYQFDPSTCDTTYIGGSSIGFGDIALTSDGRLFGISSSYLYEIDTGTAQASLITALPVPFNAVSLVALDNEHLLLESWDSLCVVGLDGSFTVLGYIGFEASGDLTWYHGDLYMTHSYSSLIRIRLDESHTTIIDVDSIGVIPTTFGDVYGTVTIRTGPCRDDLRMIAFDGFDVYLVDPSNAQTTPWCMSAFQYATDGAATSTESEQVENQPLVSNINVFSPNGDGINDHFSFPASRTATTIEVYDRWGLCVSTSDAAIGWNGISRSGMACPEGVYFFILRPNSGCGAETTTTGHLTLLR